MFTQLKRVELCVFLSISWSFGFCLQIDQCSVGIKSRTDQSIVLSSSNCTEGTLYWSYPQGTLQVDIPEEDERFTFCLGYVHDPFVRFVRSKSFKDSTLIELPNKQGQLQCLDSNGGLSLKFFGPNRRKTYMAFIPYKILYVE